MSKNPIIAYGLSVVILMELIDGSALNTALPQIAHALSVNPISLKVAITIYLLTLGLFIPASTWVAKRLGARRVLFCSIIGFVLSSVACGLSPNLTMLVFFRALQGFFGAFAMPVARAVVVRIYKDNVSQAMKIMGTVVATGPMLGPLLGGAITTYINWRYIFFINIPVGLSTLWIVYVYIPSFQHELDKKTRFDWLGFLQLGVSVGAFMFVIDTIIDRNISWVLKIGALILSVVLLVSYLRYAKAKKGGAVLDLKIFRNKAFSFLVVMNVLIRVSSMGTGFLYPFYLQSHQGFSSFEAGLAMLAFIIPAWSVKQVVNPVLKKLGFARMLSVILLSLAICYLGMFEVLNSFNLYFYLVFLFVLGLSFGSFTMILNTGVYSSVTTEEIGATSMIMSAVIQLSSAFGVAWMAVCLALFSHIADISVQTIVTKSAFGYVMIICATGVLSSLFYFLFGVQRGSLKNVALS